MLILCSAETPRRTGWFLRYLMTLIQLHCLKSSNGSIIVKVEVEKYGHVITTRHGVGADNWILGTLVTHN
jgi:hypothetical protein